MKQETTLFGTELVLKEVTVLDTGKSFGELALIQKKPRAATVICREDCHFAVMERKSYEKVLKQIEQRALNQKLDFLGSIPIFAGWSRRDLAKLHYYFSLKKFLRGHVVYRAGQKPTHVFLVRSGEFEVSCLTPSPFVKKEQKFLLLHTNQHTLLSGQKAKNIFPRAMKMRNMVVRIAGVGGILGEEGCLSEEPYKYTVRCKSLCGELLVIPIDNFSIQLDKHKEAIDLLKHDNTLKQASSEERISSFNQIQDSFSHSYIEEPKNNQSVNIQSLAAFPYSRKIKYSTDLGQNKFSARCMSNRYPSIQRPRPSLPGQAEPIIHNKVVLPSLNAFRAQASIRRELANKVEPSVKVFTMRKRNICSNQAYTLSSSRVRSLSPF